MRVMYFGAVAAIFLLMASEAHAVRIMTNPATADDSPDLEFDNFTLTPDGSTIVAVGILDNSLVGDVVYTFPVPANPVTDTVTATRIVVDDFVTIFDSNGPPVVSPDGSTVLYVNDSRTAGEYTIHKLAIGGTDGPLNGLFSSTGSNNVGTGMGNFDQRYSTDGNTIFFINSETGFGGSVPDFETPSTPDNFGAPDWDQIYSVPSAGGTPTAVTMPSDGDIDINLWDLTPSGNIVYAPDQIVDDRFDLGGVRQKLFTIPNTGGAATEISIATAPNPTYTIEERVVVTPDGNNVLFVADYDTAGKFELYSLPIAGGTPTRVSDSLPFAGDVTGFEVSPDGTNVAYIAGQNTSSNKEVFLKSITGTPGTSVRVSDPASANGGQFDVSAAAKGGLSFSNSGTELYYIGDFETNGVFDLYVVDTTEKTGLVPSAYTYVGAANGEFFDENNWQDAQGNNPAADSINPDTAITHSLIINGDTVSTALAGQVDFGSGGSLELTSGSVLNLLVAGNQLDFNANSGLKITNATINVDDDVFLEGTNYLTGGSIESVNDDIEFGRQFEAFISGTTLTAGDNIFFDNSTATITGATLLPADRLGLRFGEVTLTDANINVQSGVGDIDDVFSSDGGEGAVLTLKGASTLLADTVAEGVDLILEDSSIATFNGLDFDMDSDNVTTPPFAPYKSFITLNSFDAQIVLSGSTQNLPGTTTPFDARTLIINGITGLSYADDPTAWNVTNWDGMSALASLKLVAPLDGDFDNDGDVDGDDFLVWQRGGSPNPLSGSDLTLWRDNYGTNVLLAATASVPEPSSGLLCLLIVGLAATQRSGRR